MKNIQQETSKVQKDLSVKGYKWNIFSFTQPIDALTTVGNMFYLRWTNLNYCY